MAVWATPNHWPFQMGFGGDGGGGASERRDYQTPYPKPHLRPASRSQPRVPPPNPISKPEPQILRPGPTSKPHFQGLTSKLAFPQPSPRPHTLAPLPHHTLRSHLQIPLPYPISKSDPEICIFKSHHRMQHPETCPQIYTRTTAPKIQLPSRPSSFRFQNPPLNAISKSDFQTPSSNSPFMLTVISLPVNRRMRSQ